MFLTSFRDCLVSPSGCHLWRAIDVFVRLLSHGYWCNSLCPLLKRRADPSVFPGSTCGCDISATAPKALILVQGPISTIS